MGEENSNRFPGQARAGCSAPPGSAGALRSDERRGAFAAQAFTAQRAVRY